MAEDGIWVYVRTLIDECRFKAPLEHLQEYREIEIELLEENRKRDLYVVFYSPKPKETPASLKKAEGRILKIDDLDPKVYQSMLKQHKNGIPGWYNAVLLQWEESLEDLNAVTAPDSSKVSSKVSRMRSSTAGSSRGRGKSQKGKPSARTQHKIEQENGRRNNLKCFESNSTESEDTPDSGDELEGDSLKATVRRLRLKCAEQCVEIKELKAALKKSDEQRSDLERLNIKWQEKELNRKRSGSSSSSSNRNKSEERFHPYKKTSSHREKTKPEISKAASDHDSAMEDTVSTDSVDIADDLSTATSFQTPAKGLSSPMLKSVPNISLKNLEKPLEEDNGIKCVKPINTSISMTPRVKTTAARTPVKSIKTKQSISMPLDITKEDFMLNCSAPEGVCQITYEQFQTMVTRAKAGQGGDSQFIKECMAQLWDDEELAARSAAGGVCPVNPGSRPPLTPVKKEYLTDVLRYRISHEPGAVEDNNITARTAVSTINNIANKKIGTVRSSIKTRMMREENK